MPDPSLAPKATPPPLPTLPFEVVRRIISHRLALPPPYPTFAQASDPDAQYGTLDAGLSGRKAAIRAATEREDVQRAALGLLRVCKAWKPIVLRQLYASPYLDPFSFLLLTDAVLRGDKKWDNLRLHPHSLPGRYITTLDLSSLDSGGAMHDHIYMSSAYAPPQPHITSLNRACLAIFPAVPNVVCLRLPMVTTCPCSAMDVASAPFAGGLKALEGVRLGAPGWAEEEVVAMLRGLRGLQVLSVYGAGLAGVAANADAESVVADSHQAENAFLASSSGPPLALSHLHTLTLDGLPSGPLLSALIAAPLPSLRRLLITSYASHPSDQTYAFQQTHGDPLLSLTYLPTREWPAIKPSPPAETLELHPNLRHLAILLPHSVLQKNLELAEEIGRTARDPLRLGGPHPLRSLVIPKWNSGRASSPSPTPSPAPSPAQTPAAGLSAPPATLHASSSTLNPAPTAPSYFAPLAAHSSIAPSAAASASTRRSNRFLHTLLRQPPPNLSEIAIDGFTWVSASLGRAALEAGQSGEMRMWACELARRGISLRDGEGREAPGLAAKAFGTGAGLSAGALGGTAGGPGGIGRTRTAVGVRDGSAAQRAGGLGTGNGGVNALRGRRQDNQLELGRTAMVRGEVEEDEDGG